MTDDSKAEEAKSFHAVVGLGISSWALIENLLIRIASVILGAPTEKTGLVLYSIQNFHSWLNIIDELLAFDAAYGEPKQQWNKISDVLRKLNDQRVRLAHNTTIHEEAAMLFKIGVSLKPGTFDVRKKVKEYEPMTGEQVGKFIDDVGNMGLRLGTLLNDVLAVALQQKSPPQQGGQPPEDAR